MRRYDVIREICDAMLALGWEPYQNDHEDANGQFEMNWAYDDALVTADRHASSSSWSVAGREARSARDVHAEAVRAPDRQRLPRAYLAVGRRGKINLFDDPDGELGLSQLGLSFPRRRPRIRPRRSLRCLNPTVNTYKRINAPPTFSGATWSPNTVTYSGNNRTHMVRIPEPGRFELRLTDGAANPYLLQAGILAAGLDGIAQQARSRPAARHQHVRARRGARRHPAPAAKPTRRSARLRRLGDAASIIWQ